MKCTSCSAVAPFMENSPYKVECIFCSGHAYPDANDLLSEPTLGFVAETRPGQIALAENIVDDLRDENAALYEAGTGVGKSFAYLLPAILAGGRTIISTAKISLQTQLVEKDLPFIKKFLAKIGHPKSIFSFAPAYGKSNYACYYLCHKHHNGKKGWNTYEKFFTQSTYGHWDDSKKLHLRLDQSLNAENCMGPECNYYKQCGYVKARGAMIRADVVVTNNWLLGYHFKLMREDPPVYLLDGYDHLIVDEAHKVEDGIRQAFSSEVKLDFLKTIDRNFNDLQSQSKNPLALLRMQSLEPLWKQTINELDKVYQAGTNTIAPSVERDIKDTMDGLEELAVEVLSEPTFEGLFKDGEKYKYAPFRNYLIDKFVMNNDAAKKVNSGLNMDELYMMDSIENMVEYLYTARRTLGGILDKPKNKTWMIQKNTFKGKTNLYLKMLPINIGEYMPKRNVVYLSATLSLDGSFNDFAKRVGLLNAPHNEEVFPSPFDLKKQAYLYVPKTVPVPETRNVPSRAKYRDSIAEQVYRLLLASQGDAFVLFSSKDELEHVKHYLVGKALPYPIFSQGDYSPAEALMHYRQTPKASLLGLKSFWEGVDVSGDKLFLVIITKLPFPIKSDPIVKARREQYNDPIIAFNNVDIPDMLLDLRQGIGRLIRSKQDRGMVVVLDSRLFVKRYGKKVLRTIGLPAHTDLEKVCRGLASRHAK